MPKIEEICATLKVLSEAKSRGELMMAPEVGERLGMTAQHAGPLLGNMHERQPVKKPEKGKNRYQITEKGEEFLVNPPKETEVKKEVLPTVPPTVPLTVPPTPPKEDSVIPSQADIFRSIAEQLGITKAMDTAKGGTPQRHNQLCSEDGPAEQSTVSCSRPAQKAASLPRHISRCYRRGSQDHRPAGIQSRRGSFQATFASLLQLKVLYQASEPMMPVEVGERIGMTAFYTGQLLRDLRNSGLTERADKKKHLHQITQRGRDWLATPPPAKLPPEPPTTTAKNDGTERQQSTELSTGLRTELSTRSPKEDLDGEEEDWDVPSESDIFRSIGERLGLDKQKDGAPSARIIHYVQRRADVDDLNSLWNAVKPIE